MSTPTQSCIVCGDTETVRPDGRGFPPQIARNRLAKRCKDKGHRCQSVYRAGVTIAPSPRGQQVDAAAEEEQ